MKKSILKRTLTAIVAASVLGVSSIISASAATSATLSISNVEGYRGDTVTVTVDVTGNPGINAASFNFTFDEVTAAGIELVGEPVADGILAGAAGAAGNMIAASLSSANVVTKDGSLLTMEFSIPTDCDPGTYSIVWNEVATFNNGNDLQSYETADGSITVLEQTTTPEPPVTTPEETTEAPEETTEAPEETTEAPATTTTTVASEDEAPATGVKGVAATAAIMLAAAGSAVVISRKKRD